MMRRYCNALLGFASAVLVASALHADAAAAGKTRPPAIESILYSFKGGRDGSGPNSRLFVDSEGNFYGTTGGGGLRDMGTVFKLTRRKNTVLHFFKGGSDGAFPRGDLLGFSIPGLPGATVVGTTVIGGEHNLGTVFEVTSDGDETVLYSFTGGADGANPMAGLLMDQAGKLYGTTSAGGDFGFGTVFELKGKSVKVLHAFKDRHDGASPVSKPVVDSHGNLIGTTQSGGGRDGTIYMLTPTTRKLKALHSFLPSRDGTDATLSEFTDTPGVIYGTAIGGGPGHAGTAFRLTPKTRKFEVVFAFDGKRLGANPVGSLAGFCGVTVQGGARGGGTVFRLNADSGTARVLHSFGAVGDGLEPGAGLIEDEVGNVFGTTRQGGQFGNGTVFEVSSCE
jgi:uncharacterized repeat protein (TIGR03803 family)